jgi:rhamnosyltransferase
MNPSVPLAPRVCAVIVTYNPHPRFMANVAAINAQTAHSVVVDNGSSSSTQQYLQALEAQHNCTVIRNPQNLGIAAALNLGVRYAMEAEFDWVATFDQDSCVSGEFVSQMLSSYRNATHPEKIAVLAPTYVDRESGIPGALVRARNGEILHSMASGSMMPASALRIVGAFDESLYMDYVDIEFCLRARRKGMLILQSPAVLYHSLGRITQHRFFGRGFGTTNHSAARRYYITRNRLRLLMNYAADWPWAWREIYAMLAEAAKVALIENNKWKKFQAMAAGTADALGGKAGRQIEL